MAHHGKLWRRTQNRLDFECLRITLVEVDEAAEDRAAMHAAGECQVDRLHAGFGCFDGMQANGFERDMVKLAGISLLIGGNAPILRK